MFLFGYNDCIPEPEDEYSAVSVLDNSLSFYNDLSKRFPDELDGIITSSLPSNISLNSLLTLQNCIEKLSKEKKVFAYSLFNKYPIENNFGKIDVDELLKFEYQINANGDEYDAINLRIFSIFGGMAFTLPFCDDLKVNELTISASDGKSSKIPNLFGEEGNNEFLAELISAEIASKLGAFDKLLLLFDEYEISEKFEEDFEKLNSDVQIGLINLVKKAIDREGATKFFADNDLIKDVTPENEKEIKVYELRMFTPVANRMYFYENTGNNKVYLARVKKKPEKRVQTQDINSSRSIIKQMIALE